MSLKAVTIIILLACMVLSATMAASADETQKTLYWSPVTLDTPCTSLSLEDAQNINYSMYDELGAQSVHISVITAQLYLNGAPYKMANIPITFTSDNDSVAVLEPNNRTRPSDANGQAKILLIANNTVGFVNITAKAMVIQGHELSDTCTVRVVGWGTVSGIVTDQNRNGVPDATVTLWHWNGTANVNKLASHDNPQLSNDGRTAAPGMYTFVYVPTGSYNVTAEKDGHIYYRLFDLHQGEGTITANVAIPDYTYINPVTATPVPATTATPQPSPAATATPRPTPALPILFVVGAFCMAVLLKRH